MAVDITANNGITVIGRVNKPLSFKRNILQANSNNHGAIMGSSTFQNPALGAYLDKAHQVKMAKAILWIICVQLNPSI